MKITGYQESDLERFHDEPAKRSGRSEFARDRARVIHSFALRRLAAKTQVAVPWADDFPRTRLSHSLECAQVGREIGESLGADPDLMDTACLAHDLGHPPFGHNGEVALNEIATSCGGFEGNAQSFRILTRLEGKTVDRDGKSLGLNLTRASLDAATKYPWHRSGEITKFGVYEDDGEVFSWMRNQDRGRSSGRTSLEAQIMDWSDDVAYSVHDLEDGVVTGKIIPIKIESHLAEIAETVRNDYLADLQNHEFESATKRLLELELWPRGYDGSHYALAQMKRFTSQLIGEFALAAEKATRDSFGSAPLTRYSANLEIPRSARVDVAILKAISGYFIINAESAQAAYLEQRTLLKELVLHLRESAPRSLESTFLSHWDNAKDESARLRVIIDQVASFTDLGAIKRAHSFGLSLAIEKD
ncbi:MAG: deoxyguanosinetriphosphate triphosphohydrolase [Actinobacteria bacterium]|nr:deoxyguanosinetriphosphate triphosphohydrolase [Actinomycetota bacterium]